MILLELVALWLVLGVLVFRVRRLPSLLAGITLHAIVLHVAGSVPIEIDQHR